MAEPSVTYRNHGIKLIGGVLFVLVAVTAALWLVPRGEELDPDSGKGSGALTVGRKMGDFELISITGQSARLSSFGKKILMLNFWATWCPPCMAEMPTIQELRNDYVSRGFEVLGVNLDDDPASAVPKTVERMGLRFPMFMDPDGATGNLFGVEALPTTVVVNASGVILFVERGDRDWSSRAFRKRLDAWLDEASETNP
ncbi:MAG: TlpA family protein disulfide reductase [Bdellovibrionales bacterium]|nr:TlpA family protein disulfide reductase [Bdellovibrionales bacterium]